MNSVVHFCAVQVAVGVPIRQICGLIRPLPATTTPQHVRPHSASLVFRLLTFIMLADYVENACSAPAGLQISAGKVRFGFGGGGGGHRAAAVQRSGRRWRARASWRRPCGSGPAAQLFLGRWGVCGDRVSLAWALLAWPLCSAAGRSGPPSAPSSAPSRPSGHYYSPARAPSLRLSCVSSPEDGHAC